MKKVWIRAGITLHTDLEPEEIKKEILLKLIKNDRWKLDGETLIYREDEVVRELNFLKSKPKKKK